MFKQKFNINSTVNNKNKCKIDYFISGPEKETDMKVSAVITHAIHINNTDNTQWVKLVFTGIDCFKETFYYRSKMGSNP